MIIILFTMTFILTYNHNLILIYLLTINIMPLFYLLSHLSFVNTIIGYLLVEMLLFIMVVLTVDGVFMNVLIIWI